MQHVPTQASDCPRERSSLVGKELLCGQHQYGDLHCVINVYSFDWNLVINKVSLGMNREFLILTFIILPTSE